MPAVQTRFWPDARPLVERLGRDFFRTLPTHAGVYRLLDAHETVLYVGKAKNLRQRLNSYRVANPERLPRRLVRLLNRAQRIEWEACADEAAALARESELLLALKPRFNRAGVWPAPPKFLAWRVTDLGVELAIVKTQAEGWACHGPLGSRVVPLRALLVRRLWCALHPAHGIGAMPAGWFDGSLPECVVVPWGTEPQPVDLSARLTALFAGETAGFVEWLTTSTPPDAHSFDRLALTADLELLADG